MEITVKHEIPCDPTEESRCIYDGDFWGNEVCRYHTHRDRTHGRKAPIERQQPKCTLFDEWLPGNYVKCESCRKAIEAAEQKPQPLTIEELQEFIDSDEEDNAIWVKDMKHDYFTRALLDWDRDRGIFAIWHGDKDTSDFPIEKDYGKTWLAYRTKPEGSGK